MFEKPCNIRLVINACMGGEVRQAGVSFSVKDCGLFELGRD